MHQNQEQRERSFSTSLRLAFIISVIIAVLTGLWSCTAQRKATPAPTVPQACDGCHVLEDRATGERWIVKPAQQ